MGKKEGRLRAQSTTNRNIVQIRNLQTAKILPRPFVPSHHGLIFTHNLGCWTQGVLEDMGHAS